MTSSKPKRSKTASRAKADQGGWFLRQLVQWVAYRGLEAVRKASGEPTFIYYSQRDPDFPKRQDAETDAEIILRISEHKRSRSAEGSKILSKARDAILGTLRSGKLTAIDRTSNVVSCSTWQRMDLHAPEARQQYVYPSARAQRFWQARAAIGKPMQSAVDAWMLNFHQQARLEKRPAPKRENAIHVCHVALGARVLQARAALQKVPSHLKNRSKSRQLTRTK